MPRSSHKAERSRIARDLRRLEVRSAGQAVSPTRIRLGSVSVGDKNIRLPLSRRQEGYGGRILRNAWGYKLSGIDFTDPWIESVLWNPRNGRLYWRTLTAYLEAKEKGLSLLCRSDVQPFAEKTFLRARRLASRLDAREDDKDLVKAYQRHLGMYRYCESLLVKDPAEDVTLELLAQSAIGMYAAAREAYEKQRPPEAELPELVFDEYDMALANLD